MADEKNKAASRIPLIFSEIEALRKQGDNQSEIAEMHGVSRQAVSWHKQTYGGYLTYRQVVNKAWPWKTTNLHGKSKVYQRLRDHGKYMLTQGSGMSEDKLTRLRSWWRKLRNDDHNLVVEFDPALPPLRGVSPHGGFALRQRAPEDLDLLILVNENTTLTEGGRRIWCWPTDSAIWDLEPSDPAGALPPTSAGSGHIYLTSVHKRISRACINASSWLALIPPRRPRSRSTSSSVSNSGPLTALSASRGAALDESHGKGDFLSRLILGLSALAVFTDGPSLGISAL
ncbi:hypothetical protein [Mycobacterium sp. M26]|uniref:hypothetical protein n=1 Tax=Mycobacterium sp. M26 TaxID=1762962 RepID=UPI000AFB87E3|nr:hypothetical protein [Mycobacterium sp. M26]